MATGTRNFYNVLGVNRGASDEEIRRAYRRLAREHHPDVNRGDRASESRFKLINEAYEVLGDAKNRRDYDEFGDQWRHADELRSRSSGVFGGRGGRGTGSMDFGSFGGGFPFSEMFGFGDGGRSRHLVETDVTLEEAFSGVERTVSVSTPGGSVRNIAVRIPAGIADGGTVRVMPSGMGHLDVKVRIRRHHEFERVGDDLRSEFKTPLHVPVLGGTARVRTLDGAVELKVPAGTQNGMTFKLSGKGMPKLSGSGRGDLITKLKVVLPESVGEEERRLFERLKELQERRP